MNEALINAEKLKKFLKDSLEWFILGMAIAGIGWKIQYNRSSQLEDLLTTSQKNERLSRCRTITIV